MLIYKIKEQTRTAQHVSMNIIYGYNPEGTILHNYSTHIPQNVDDVEVGQ